MGRVYVFFAQGYEEIEALSVVDILRRAKHDVQMVSIGESIHAVSTHGIDITMNGLFGEYDYKDADILVLPGGMPGTTNLLAHKGLEKVLRTQYENKKWIGAICAAPSVLSEYGFLNGRTATSYPGTREKIKCERYVTDKVVIDGNIITSRGVGTALEFALKIIEVLDGPDIAKKISDGIVM